jgi:hypothetical protein
MFNPGVDELERQVMSRFPELAERLRGTQDLVDEARGGTVDRQAARELELYMDNDREVYRWKHTDYYKNLAKKAAAGRYNRDQAVKLFMYLVERAGKKYVKELGGSYSMFSKPTRELVAKALRDEFEAFAKESPKELEKFIPKKYQGKPLKL